MKKKKVVFLGFVPLTDAVAVLTQRNMKREAIWRGIRHRLKAAASMQPETTPTKA